MRWQPRWPVGSALCLVAALAGCGKPTGIDPLDAAPRPDAPAGLDAGAAADATPGDAAPPSEAAADAAAGPDAAPPELPAAPVDTLEITSAGGRLRGGGLVL